MAKQLLYTDDARKKLLTGAEKLAKAVGITLGPTGRNVIIDKSFGGPTVTKDGVTVSKEIELPDPFENMGAKLVNAVAQKTNDAAGDGTTTATVLALAIYSEGLRNITAGANPMAVKRGIDKAVAKAVEHLETSVGKPNTDMQGKDVEYVATISANNNPTIGKMMAEAFDRVGNDGVITIEEGKTNETVVEYVSGMQFDKGFISPYFVVNTPDLKWEATKPLILLYEKKLSNVREFLPLLEKVAQARRPLLIVAEDVEAEALQMLVVNKLRNLIDVCAVKAPGFGDRRKAMMGDMATLTGGTFLSEDLGVSLENVELDQLGSADQVTVDKDNCTIICEKQDKKREQAVADRVAQIRTQRDATESTYDKEKFTERLAKLVGGVAIFRVGAATETEMKNQKDLIEDALHATRAAVAEGIVPGGGVALLRCVPVVRELAEKLKGDERTGAKIVARALAKPLHTIASNAGEDGAVIVEEVMARGERNTAIGYNATTGEYEDLFKAGIIDPTTVTKSALTNAASIAGLMLTTEVMITKVEEEDDKSNKVSGAVA